MRDPIHSCETQYASATLTSTRKAPHYRIFDPITSSPGEHGSFTERGGERDGHVLKQTRVCNPLLRPAAVHSIESFVWGADLSARSLLHLALRPPSTTCFHGCWSRAPSAAWTSSSSSGIWTRSRRAGALQALPCGTPSIRCCELRAGCRAPPQRVFHDEYFTTNFGYAHTRCPHCNECRAAELPSFLPVCAPARTHAAAETKLARGRPWCPPKIYLRTTLPSKTRD